MSKSADALQARDEIRRIGEAIGMRHIGRLALDRIAAQRDEVANALIPVATRDVEHFAARSADTGEMRRARERRLALNARDETVRALTRRSICAIRHGDEARRERHQALHRLPQRGFHFRVARRKELEGDIDWHGLAH